MGYLLPAEYEAYGLEAETADAFVAMASALMESHCRRPTLMAAQYTERVRLTAASQTARLSYGPLLPLALLNVRVRYARGRRGEAADLQLDRNGLMGLQIATAFGLPGTWSTLDVATIDVYAGIREITFPFTFLGLGYNEAEITYMAGFVTVPVPVKVACAQLVKNAQATPALNVKTSRLDTMHMDYFSASLLDEGVRVMLKPYLAERL